MGGGVVLLLCLLPSLASAESEKAPDKKEPRDTLVATKHTLQLGGEKLDYAASAEGRGLKVIITGAGGAAHLAGVVASKTTLPILGVPIQSKALQGLDSLLSIVQMPAGIPVATFAIGNAGAANAALFAVAILAIGDPALSQRLKDYRQKQAEKVLAAKLPEDNA